jgi:mRNA-degrading endonuclease toxin of MazEF toxin-antitoxin module
MWLDAGPTSGREQDRRRPWVVLSDHGFNGASGLAHCVPCTTTVKGSKWEVPLEGLERPTAVLWAHSKTLDWRAREAEFYGETASEDVMNRLRLRIGSLLGIPMMK